MRLIDADALVAQMEADAEQMEEPIAQLFTYAAISDVKHAPTIDTEPQWKKGKWEIAYLDHVAMGERPSIFYCSVCNQCIAYPVNYCPNCGADMRGEEE